MKPTESPADKPQWPDDAPAWAQWMTIDFKGNKTFYTLKPGRICDGCSLIQRPQNPEPNQARRETALDWWDREGRQVWMLAGNGPKKLAIAAWDASAINGDGTDLVLQQALNQSQRDYDQLTRERDEDIQRRNEALLDDSAFHELQRQLEQALDERDEARRELASLQLKVDARRQLVRSTEDHQNVIQTLIERDRQLSDARAEVSRLSGMLARFNEMEKEPAIARVEMEAWKCRFEASEETMRFHRARDHKFEAEVKRLEGELKHSKYHYTQSEEARVSWRSAYDASQATVERLRGALTTLGKNVKMLQHHSGLASGMEGQGRTQEARAQWKCFDQLVDDSLQLASLTSPTTITSENEVTRLQQALQLATDWIKQCPPNDTSKALLEKIQTLTSITEPTASVPTKCQHQWTGGGDCPFCEIIRLRDLVAKPHNPAGLTPNQWEWHKGWRLLDEDEIYYRPRCYEEIQEWNVGGWSKYKNGGSHPESTYRTKLSRADLAAISKGEKP